MIACVRVFGCVCACVYSNVWVRACFWMCTCVHVFGRNRAFNHKNGPFTLLPMRWLSDGGVI